MSARGSAVANCASANSSGVCDDWEKSMVENVAPPEETSGTLEIVVAVVEQVMLFWMADTVSATSPGSAVVPIMKQALACRDVRAVVGRAVEADSMLRMASAEEVEGVRIATGVMCMGL